jgi:membrane associated rhomboid family serine protease
MRRTITGSLLLIIAVSYLLQITTVGYEDRFLLNRFYIENGEYYRLFTVALLHGGLWHLAFNLLALYALGTPLENYFGKGRYILILFISLICGSTLSVLSNPPYVYSIGASGMIFGLFSALALVGKSAGIEWWSISIIVGLNFAIGFVLGGVDWSGHLGGLIGGVLITLTLNRLKRVD